MGSDSIQELQEFDNDVSGYWEADAHSLQFRPSSLEALTNISYSDLTAPVSWFDLLPSGESDQGVETLRAAARNRRSFSFDTTIKIPAGGVRWVRIVGDSPRPDTLRGFITDFTDSKAAEIDAAARHQESNERLMLLTSIAGTVIGSLEFEEQVKLMADQIRKAFQVDTCVVRVFVEGELELLAGSGTVVSGLPPKISAETGLAKLVLESKGAFAVHDSREADCDSRGRTFVSYAGAPLKVKDRVLGVISISTEHEVRPFSQGDLEHLQIVANSVAVAVHNNELFRRTEFHLKRLHSLSIIHATVSENHNLRTTLDMLIEQLRSQTGIDAAAIHLYEEVSASFRLETSAGFGPGMAVPSLGRDVIVNRYRSKLSDLQETGTRGRRFGAMIAAGFDSYLAVPLIANENIVGVLEIYHKTELPQDVDLDNFVEMLASQAAIAVDNATLLKSLRTANKELIAAYDATIEGWARALDLRDHETEGHSRRVTDMTVDLARLVGVPASQIAHMRRGALLHDIGKMAIPDSVLHKPGELDQNELVIMRRHPGIALNLLEPVTFLKEAIDIPFCHHEKWDGTGYPRGLKEHHIPLSARIFAVVDVWDALRSDRPYRKRWSIEQAVHYVRVQSGRQFDPDIVEVFLNNLDKFDHWDK